MASTGTSGGAGTTQAEQQQARAVGAGNAETTQHEWAVNQHRDSIATYLGNRAITEYFALAEGVPSARVRLNLLNRLHRPCGEAPRKRSLAEIQTSEEMANGANQSVVPR